MKIDLYVQSAGHSGKHDYKWKAIYENNQEIIDDPPLVKEFQHLLDSKALSLLLVREENQLLLLVTDIPSQGKDYRDRTIRNSVAWIGKDKDEPVLRALAVRALQIFQGQDSLKDEVNNAVELDENVGFKVNINAIEAHTLAKITVESKPQTFPSNIAKLGNDRVKDLIEDLRQYKLPEKDGALVVVTGNKAQSALEGAKVWRGLSNLVQYKDWEKYQKMEVKLPEKKKTLFGILSAIPLTLLMILFLNSQNHPPIISGMPPTTIEVSNSYNFIPKAEDKDGDNLEFSIENKPSWVTFDQKTGRLSGTPYSNDVGTTSNIVISVTDGKKIVTLPAFDLVVTPPTSINVNQTYSFTPVVKDLNSQTLEFSIENKPSWVTFDQKTGRLSGTPNPDDVGTAPDIVISVTDGEKTVNLPPFNLTVNESQP